MNFHPRMFLIKAALVVALTAFTAGASFAQGSSEKFRIRCAGEIFEIDEGARTVYVVNHQIPARIHRLDKDFIEISYRAPDLSFGQVWTIDRSTGYAKNDLGYGSKYHYECRKVAQERAF